MKAKRKPLDVKSAADFGIDLSARTTLLKLPLLLNVKQVLWLKAVDELVEKLKNEAKVIS